MLWWFLLYINMNQPQIYMCSPTSWTRLHLPSLSHPSGLSQSTGFGCSASCIELVLVIYFTYANVHVSMLFSQIIPPSLSPLSPKFCSLYECPLCCPACRTVSTIFLNSIYIYIYIYMYMYVYIYIYINILYLSFFFWLTSLCVIGSRFIHLIRTESNAFLFIAE